MSLLPWKSKRVEESKGGAGTAAGAADKGANLNGTKFVHVRVATGSTPSRGPVIDIGPSPHSKSESDHTLCESPTSTPTPDPDPSTDSRKNRRSTFGFLSTPSFRPKREREKSSTLDFGKAGSNQHTPAHVNVKSKGIPNSVESGTDSTSTSIHTIAQGSQTTLVPASGSMTPPLYDLTSFASFGSSAVPMVRRLNSQTAGIPDEPLPNPWEPKGSSTPSLLTTGSTATSSSIPRTLTASSFVPRPSALKASFTDTSEEEDRVHLRVPATGVHVPARSGTKGGKGVPRDLVVPVYGHGGGPEVDRDAGPERGPVVPVRSKTMAMGDRLEVPNAESPSKVRKRRRPQTAPTGGGDAIRYVEETKTVMDVSVDVDVGFGAGGRVAKRKGGPSRLKTVLKGLLKWGG
ncbi:hypothetical protein JVU11DRAFT_6047 [Chiua virens]|nr:hypothetical protein JVU11DRAFT_6047 [Chiua virens]